MRLRINIVENYPRTFFWAGVLFYMFHILMILSKLPNARANVKSFATVELDMVLAQCGVLFWMLVLYFLNPLRIRSASKADFKNLNGQKNPSIFTEQAILKKNWSARNLFRFRYSAAIILFAVFWGALQYHGLNIFLFFRYFFNLLGSADFPIPYKITLSLFIITTANLLLFDTQQIAVYAIRMRTLKMLIVYWIVLTAALTAILFILQFTDDSLNYGLLNFEFKKHCSALICIAFYMGMIYCEYLTAKTYLKQLNEKSKQRLASVSALTEIDTLMKTTIDTEAKTKKYPLELEKTPLRTIRIKTDKTRRES